MNKKNLRIGIYTGNGASHSWLWFVGLFEKAGILDIEFIDSLSIKNNNLSVYDALIFSGGDTFSIAESVGEDGAEILKEFISAGGLYMGSCAGAYFPLDFDFPPLNYFNVIDATIANFSATPPQPRILTEKFSCPYGDGYVFHPVREEVVISFEGALIPAPIYGGPAFVINHDANVLARYHSFTEKSLFLCDRKLAEEIYLNKPAVIGKKLKDGFLILTGPHLEHPYYESANKKLLELIDLHTRSVSAEKRESTAGTEVPLYELKKIVSNLRIIAGGLIAKGLMWKVGRKTYEAEKIAYFVEFVWNRVKKMNTCVFDSKEHYLKVSSGFVLTALLLKELSENNTDENFEKLLPVLKLATTGFLSAYFLNKKLERKKLYA